MKIPLELLAPARNLQTGIAAINSGADAVYIGIEKFGARKSASNSLQDVEKLIRYAHQYFAKVYITFNTILFDYELEEAQQMIEQIAAADADGLIIQDWGILKLNLHGLPLIASTQMHNAEVEQIKFLESVGFKRAILARELSLAEIAEIRSKTKEIELEFFVHGALCVSYSGRCFMSYCSTGRSANRGECAQFCRHSFSLSDKTGKILVKDKYLLSLKDLNLSDYLDELVNSGITSFKIEGRLKNESYVKNVVAFYRRKLDELIDKIVNIKKPVQVNR